MRSRIFFKLMFVFLLVIGATAITLQLTVHESGNERCGEQIERNLKQKTLMFAYRVETDRQHSLAELPPRRARPRERAPRSSILPARCWPIPKPIPGRWRTTGSARSLLPHSRRDRMEERKSHTLDIPFVYVAAPVSGGAVRLAYPLPEIEITDRPLAVALFGDRSRFHFCDAGGRGGFALCGLAPAADCDFAERVASGDLTARIASTSTDEIGQVAAALDKTTRHVEASFARVQTSQHELETLLNSMQDAVIAVDVGGRVQWANRGMDRLLLRAPRLDAPLIDSVGIRTFSPRFKRRRVSTSLLPRDRTRLLRGGRSTSRRRRCPAAVRLPCSEILPTLRGWRRRAAISSPTSPMNCARR